MTSARPGLNARPDVRWMPPRTSKATGGTPRRVTFVRWPPVRLGSDMIITDSQDAMTWPSAPRARRESASIKSRSSAGTSDSISEAEPRVTIIALSGRPVERSADENPSVIAISTANTATTSVIPTTARTVRRQRTRTLRTV